ncbi:hypothetical protein [Flavobacterium sp. I3-2]|uniref:hypothetical protein n=1 Tax=Flavobacterium sp. I3-2 TaxID=2748319 RepID=UPI0015B10BEF|nr:hypothetical protein [Flavobacterium sp. I3-2]
MKHLKEEAERELKENENVILNFIDISKNKGIELTKENFSYIQTIGIVVSSKDILLKLNEDIVLDKDNLIDYKFICSKFEKRLFAKGYLYSENYISMASPFFRRGFHFVNDFQPRFIEKFWEIKPDDYDELKISLDHDHLRINVDNSAFLELDTWYGVKFDKNIENISDQPIKLRPSFEFDSTDISFFFADAYCLDIKWSTNQNIKTFQAEEIKTESVTTNIDGIEYFPVRYIHAEFDTLSKTFRHFDGAIHFYTIDEYYQRRDSDLNFNSKISNPIKSKSKKIFKINGEINIDVWVDFCCQFFSHNPLAIEYFEGEYPKHIKEMLEKIRKSE